METLKYILYILSIVVIIGFIVVCIKHINKTINEIIEQN